jgi:hypothetical protein
MRTGIGKEEVIVVCGRGVHKKTGVLGKGVDKTESELNKMNYLVVP